MRTLVGFVCVFLVLAVAGCSGMSISSDYSDSAVPTIKQYKTYAWLPEPQGGDSRIYNDIFRSRVMDAVDRELLAKGYQKDMSGSPDFLVGYHAGLEGKLDVSTINNHYGYGYGYRYPSWYTETYVRSYTEGTLILDIVDAAAKELVWRGQAQAEVTQSSDPERRKARINEAVRKILERFPPNK